jgi:hypothetical protein
MYQHLQGGYQHDRAGFVRSQTERFVQHDSYNMSFPTRDFCVHLAGYPKRHDIAQNEAYLQEEAEAGSQDQEILGNRHAKLQMSLLDTT